MASSLPLVSSSGRIGEEEEENGNPPPTSMLLGLQHLEEQIIVATTTTTTTTTTTQLRNVPSISDIVGCDITLEDVQSTKQELIEQKADLKMDVNKTQNLPSFIGSVTPLIHFCRTGNLMIIKVLFLIGADCTKLSSNGFWFPMLLAAAGGHLDICKWLFEYGGDAKYQISKETNTGSTPLQASYFSWHHEINKNDGKICRWLLRNGGGQRFSSNAMRRFIEITEEEDINSNLLVLWMRENIKLHDKFILFLCGTTTMITTLSSSAKFSDGDIRKYTRKRKIHPERALQILDGHPGIMELIGEYVGVIRGKEFRMLQEFDELVIEYFTTEESSGDEEDDDDDDDDDDDESSSDNGNDYDNDEDEE